MLVKEKLYKPFDEIKTRELIIYICDYCGKESKQQKNSYINSHKTIEKDCCNDKDCVNSKKKDVCFKKYGIEHTSKLSESKEKMRQTCLKRFGHKHASSSPEVKEKKRQTSIKKFGYEHHFSSPEVQEKSKQTCLKRFGHKHASSSPNVQEKRKQTCLERFGHENPFSSSKVQDKIRQICLEKFGHEYALQSPEVQEKSKQTCLERFGHEHASSSPEIQEKVKQTCLDRFGVDYPMQSPEVQEKRKQTCLEKLGFYHPMQSPEIQEKVKQTCLDRFGHEYVLQSPEVQEKSRQTCLDRFGHEYALQSPEVQEKVRQTNIERYGSAYPHHTYGKTQEEITQWLNSFGFNFQSNHTVLAGKELDLYDEKLNFAIEYCGLHWHHENSPQPRLKDYHISKFKICKEKHIQLITIFEDEWLNNQEIIKSVILSKLGIFEKRIYARKCIAKEISKKEFTDFCDKHHVQGGNHLAKVCFGLYYEDELIGVMDLGVHHRKQTKDEMVLTRLCFKAGYQIIGGASKLFAACVNWCKNNEIKKIISWSDNRWSNGIIYKNLKFKLEEELGSDYSYVNMSYPKERISKQSQIKCNTGCPKGIGEKEWALQNGLSRIWDCGKVRWCFDTN